MTKGKMSLGVRMIVLVLLVAAMSIAAFAFTACGGSDEPGDKTVKSIAVATMPTKTEYVVGETFTAEGGELEVTYTDGTTETVKMTDEGVTFGEVNISLTDPDADSETKNVRVTYGKKSATFQIKVNSSKIIVTFDWCYEGDEDVTQSINAGETVRAPGNQDIPSRDGFTFRGWYADAAYTTVYDFAAAINAETTIYALWTDDSKTYHEVTFDYNYSGAPEAAVQLIESGKTAVRPMNDPARNGYTFDGWFADAGKAAEFDFAAAITAATTVYAGWTRDSSAGAQEYVFEAENTNLNGKTYPGLSGTASAGGLIQSYTTNIKGEAVGASGGKYVGYMTEEGANVTFQIVSDAEVSDATIVLRLSKELGDYTFDTSNYSIELNAKPLQFSPIEFKNVPSQDGASDVSNCYALPFQDFVIAENVTLEEGLNSISCTVMNSDAIAGTTITANGPLIDCLKITTSAVLDWSAANGLPMYY